MLLQQEPILEKLIEKNLKNWDLDRIIILEKVIIKLALCEMVYFPDIPVKVSMNEYIEISKMYSTINGKQFVNGILDAAAMTLN